MRGDVVSRAEVWAVRATAALTVAVFALLLSQSMLLRSIVAWIGGAP